MRLTPFNIPAGAALAACALLFGNCQANEILVYKYSSPRSWTKRVCYLPNAIPPLPLNKTAGTYTQTEYWIIDKTANRVATIPYFTVIELGGKVKQFVSNPAQDITRTVNVFTSRTQVFADESFGTLLYIPRNVANTVSVCLFTGDHDATDHIEGNFVGLGKPYTVAPGMVFQNVATTLTGNYMFVREFDELAQDNSVQSRYLLAEKQTTHTLTLDVLSTRNANLGTPLIPYGGGTPLTNGTLAYGQRLVELLLTGLGYDNTMPPDVP